MLQLRKKNGEEIGLTDLIAKREFSPPQSISFEQLGQTNSLKKNF